MKNEVQHYLDLLSLTLCDRYQDLCDKAIKLIEDGFLEVAQECIEECIAIDERIKALELTSETVKIIDNHYGHF